MSARMKKRGFFSDLIAPDVKASLIDIEQNAYDAVEEIGRTVRPAWRVVDVVHGIAKIDAQPWDMIVSSGGYTSTLTVLIPAPMKHNRGTEIAVARTDARPVAVQPIAGLIAGGATDTTIPATTGRVYVSTGKEWVYFA